MKTGSKQLSVLSLFLVLAGNEVIATAAQLAVQPPSLEEFRKHALTKQGDPRNGAKLFAEDPRLACAKCHSVDGTSSKAGPDLFAAGDSFGRRDLVDALLMPSAIIAPGFGTVMVETKNGETHQGVLKQSNQQSVQLMNADGKLIRIDSADIKSRQGSSVSLMPEGLQAALSLQDFTDLTEYLTTLKQKDTALASHRGLPRLIPSLIKSVGVRPFFTQDLQVPPSRVRTGLTAFYQVPGVSNVFLVLHQKGLIWRMEKTATGESKSIFSDLSQQVFSDRGPNGLLGMTFHPKCRENRKYYLKYQVFEEGKVATLIVEKKLSTDFKSDSGFPERRVIKMVSVAEDHSGGCLDFGPDGFLYFAMGDTGPHNDPNGHSQNRQMLLGKMMRIDVDHTASGRNYSIPKDNPFVGQRDVQPEIWATGFRNPWRFCFDSLTGELWLADVGQDRVEEVDIVRRGENYGWNVYEGFEPFSNQYRIKGRTFTPPVFSYGRKYGNSVTGGLVYRGDKRSSFYGVYLCGDYTSKRIFGVSHKNRTLSAVRQIGLAPQGIASFGTDEAGRIYLVGFEGMIYQLDFSESRFDQVQEN